MHPSQQRLYELVDFVLDGSCSDAEREEFGRLIDDHPQLIRALAEEVFVHSLLQWQSEDVAGDLAAYGLPDAAKTAPQVVPAPRATSSRTSSAWLLAAAAAILIVGGGITWLALFGGRLGRAAIAEVVAQDGVAWSDRSTALDQGHVVNAGRLESTGGAFALRFRSGPEVRVSGAVSMMIESDMLVHLDRGQATARVPQPLKGFTIKTPVVDVIDQGTEFGVAARDNGFTDVVVFDGKVDLRDSINSTGVPKRLIQGEAARVDRQGAIERIMQVGRDRKGAWWTSDYPATDGNVIREVRDNIPPADGSKYFCYQISYHGLNDDEFAYADHPHQWNGLTVDGLPEFLRGADYVKTFNDYRYLNDFEMVVVLSRPANLYIFFDDRVPAPAWLVEQFDDTGVDIGLDEGPWEGIPDHVVAGGGGNSIDNVFSVWLRRCTAVEAVTLGLMGEESQARAMYGIAATPLEVLEQDFVGGAVGDGT